MRKIFAVLVVGMFSAALLVAGCAQKKAASSSEAIDSAQAMKTVEEKVDYLVGQAQAFYNSKEYKDAVTTAQYVLTNLDKESRKALEILEKAKKDMAGAAQKALDDFKQTLK
jgi:hypothetical protein